MLNLTVTSIVASIALKELKRKLLNASLELLVIRVTTSSFPQSQENAPLTMVLLLLSATCVETVSKTSEMDTTPARMLIPIVTLIVVLTVSKEKKTSILDLPATKATFLSIVSCQEEELHIMV